MRLLLALLLAAEPVSAAVARAPVTGGGRPVAVPSVSALPSLPVLPALGLPAVGALSAGPREVPSLPLPAAVAAAPETPGAAPAPAPRLTERLVEAARAAEATAAQAQEAPAEAARGSGERDFAVLTGEAPPALASESLPVLPLGQAPSLVLPKSGEGGPPSPPRDPYPGSLKRMFGGTMAFKVGMEAMATSVPFVAMAALGGATSVALLVVVTYGLAQAAVGSVTGALADRFRAGRVLSGAVAAQGLALGAIVGLSALGVLSPWMLFPLYAVVGGAVGVAETARRIVPPLILGRDAEALRSYNARLHRFYEIAGVAGAGLAALLIWKLGAMNALVVGPPALLAAAWVFRGVTHGKPSRPVSEPGAEQGGWRKAREAFRRYARDLKLGAGTLLKDGRMRWVAAAMVLPQVVHRVLEGMLLPIYAKGVLGAEALSPVMITASNLGEFIGATLLLRWAAKRPGSAPWVRWGAYGLLSLWTLSLVQLFGLSPTLGMAVLFPAILVRSLTWASSHLSLETEVQERVPREVQPRVFSLLVGAYVVIAAGLSYLIGRFLDAVTLSSGFFWLNAALVGLAAFVWFASKRLAAPPPDKAG